MPLLTVQTLLIYFPGAQSEWSTVAIYNKATSGKLNVNLNKVDTDQQEISRSILRVTEKECPTFWRKKLLLFQYLGYTLLPLPDFLNVKKGADVRQAIHYHSLTKKIKLIN